MAYFGRIMSHVSTNRAVSHMSNEIALPYADLELELSHLSAMICAELATGLADKDSIKQRYGITDAQWDRLKTNPAFRAMLKETIQRFGGDMNAGKRITVKAEVALEDSIPVLYEIAHNKEGSAQNKIDSIKMMAVLANRTGKGEQHQGPAGGGFNVQIHINTGKNSPVTIEGEKT